MVRSMVALLWVVLVLVLVNNSTVQYVLWGLRGPLATRDIFVFVIVFFVFVYYSTVQRFIVVACMGSAGSIGNWSYRLSSLVALGRGGWGGWPGAEQVSRLSVCFLVVSVFFWTGVTSFYLFSYRLCLFLHHLSLTKGEDSSYVYVAFEVFV